MNIGGTQSCSTCGSSQGFEEISGLYYCLVCNTQRTGFTLEVRQYEDWNLRQLAFEDKSKKRRKKDKFNPGEPWTIVEAYNIILDHQCTQLEKKLKLGPQFRVILFSLWAEYLAKSEIAFTGTSDFSAKSSLTTSYRDLQILCEGRQNIEQLPVSCQKRRQENVYLGSIRLNRFTFTEFGERLDNKHNSDYSDEEDEGKEDSRDDYGEIVEETSKGSINCDLDDIPMEWNENTQDNFLFNYNYNAIGLENSNDCEYDSSESTSDLTASCRSKNTSKGFSVQATKATSSVASAEKRIDVNGLRLAGGTLRKRVVLELKQKARHLLERFDAGDDFDSIIKEIESDQPVDEIEKEADENEQMDNNDEIEMETANTKTREAELSKRSQILDKLIGKNEEKKMFLRKASYLVMEKLTMSKTLQFILLAFRIAGYNVHSNDLAHWTLLGHLTFYNSIKVLPDNWIIVSEKDILSLSPRQAFSTYDLEYHSAELRRFLAIPDLPHPNFNEMVIRQLYDLNLPLAFGDIIFDKIDSKLFAEKFLRYSSREKAKYLPWYETYSICSIIIVLVRIFCLDSEKETIISNNIRKKWPQSFIWDDWLRDNRTIWKLMNRHYFPIHAKIFDDISDSEVIRCHREKISQNWFGTSVQNNKYYFTTKQFKNDLAKSMEETFEVNPCTIEPPSFTVYHLHEAKRFINARLQQIEGASQPMDIFDADYANKSIDYLFDGSFFRFKSRPLKCYSTKLDFWPEPLRLLLQLSAFITQRPPDKIIWFLTRLDKHVDL